MVDIKIDNDTLIKTICVLIEKFGLDLCSCDTNKGKQRYIRMADENHDAHYIKTTEEVFSTIEEAFKICKKI